MRLLVEFSDEGIAAAFWQWAILRVNNLKRIAKIEGNALYLREVAWEHHNRRLLMLAIEFRKD